MTGKPDKALQKQWAKSPDADFNKWLGHDLWTLTEFAFLMNGKEPISESWPYNIPEFLGFYKELENRVLDAEIVGTITAVERGYHEDVFITRKYKPLDLLEWAQSKGYDIPESLKTPLENPGYIHPKKMTTLLRIIAALALEAKLDLAHPFKAADVILAIGGKHGIEMPKKPDTVAKVLKEAQDLIETQ